MPGLGRIRPLKSSDDYFSNFPEEKYDLSDSSHIVRLVKALCGDSGVGAFRKQMLLGRLQTSLYKTHHYDLDKMFGNPLSCPRLPSEAYTMRPDADLLTAAELDEIRVKDAHYRGRIRDFMRATAFGATLDGIRLAARSAIGEEVAVLEAWRYYKSKGIADGAGSGGIGRSTTAYYNEVIILPLVPSVTAEQIRLIYLAVGRLKPQDVIVTVKDHVSVDLQTPVPNEVPIGGVSASSEGFVVLQKVTGRSDWPFEYDPRKNRWIESSVEHEAPTLAFSGHEEQAFEFTSLVASVAASSEHIGRYNFNQSRLFSYLDNDAVLVKQGGANALSQVSNRFYSSSYYGGTGVFNDSYIPEYFAFTPNSNESDRGGQFWSSVERLADGSGPEDLVLTLSREVPINTLKMKVCEKPLELTPYYWDGANWVQFIDEEGLPLSFSYRAWGGDGQGGLFQIEFRTALVSTTMVKVVIQRLNIPYTSDTPRQFEPVESVFPYSVEIGGLQLLYVIDDASDYTQFSYEDVFGNVVATEMKTFESSMAHDGAEYSYWLSKANASPSAVEYLFVNASNEVSSESANMIPTVISAFSADSDFDGVADGWLLSGAFASPSMVSTGDGSFRQRIQKVSSGTTTLNLTETYVAAPGSYKFSLYARHGAGQLGDYLPYNCTVKMVVDCLNENDILVRRFEHVMQFVKDSAAYKTHDMFFIAPDGTAKITLARIELIGIAGCNVDLYVDNAILLSREVSILPQAFDTLWIDPIFGGCQMNVYVSNDVDNLAFSDKEWEPVPGVFTLERGYLRLPPMFKRYIKLEFYNLVPVPYRVVRSGIFVESEVFPSTVIDYFSKQLTSHVDKEAYEHLLQAPENSNGDDLVDENYAIATGKPDPYQATNSDIKRREELLNKGIPEDFPVLGDSETFKSDIRYSISGAQKAQGFVDSSYLSPSDKIGLENVAMEYHPEELVRSRPKAANGSVRYPKFYENGRHVYETKKVERTEKMSYMVGIREVGVYLLPRGTFPEAEHTFFVPMTDTSSVGSSTWMPIDDGVRLSPDPDSLPSVYESVDLMMGVEFQAFDFISKQRDPVQYIENPSDPQDSWEAYTDGVESVTLSPFEFADRGMTLKVDRDGAGAYGGAMTDWMLVKTNGVSEFRAQVFVKPVLGPEIIRGDWKLVVLDALNQTVKSKKLSLTPGKWEDIGITFEPEPSGTWWDEDYLYRRKVVVSAPTNQSLGVDTAVFLTELDTAALESGGKLRSDRKDLRVVFFSGIVATEIDYDYTDDSEIWFKLQQSLPAGQNADGSFGADGKTYYGAYYIYYGNASESTSPKRNIANVFTERTMASTGTPLYNTGAIVNRTNAFSSIEIDEPTMLDYNQGFVAVSYSPSDDIDVVTTIDGKHAVRTLLDYNITSPSSAAWRVRLYLFQTMLCFQVVDRPEEIDGETSYYQNTVGVDVATWQVGLEHDILCKWSPKGTNGTRGRALEVYIDGVLQEDILVRYNDGVYEAGDAWADVAGVTPAAVFDFEAGIAGWNLTDSNASRSASAGLDGTDYGMAILMSSTVTNYALSPSFGPITGDLAIEYFFWMPTLPTQQYESHLWVNVGGTYLMDNGANGKLSIDLNHQLGSLLAQKVYRVRARLDIAADKWEYVRIKNMTDNTDEVEFNNGGNGYSVDPITSVHEIAVAQGSFHDGEGSEYIDQIRIWSLS